MKFGVRCVKVFLCKLFTTVKSGTNPSSQRQKGPRKKMLNTNVRTFYYMKGSVSQTGGRLKYIVKAVIYFGNNHATPMVLNSYKIYLKDKKYNAKPSQCLFNTFES